MDNKPNKGLSSRKELESFEVVRSEFVSSVFKPRITLNFDNIGFNAACVKLFDSQFVQILIDKSKRRIVLLPCSPHAKDALKWCNEKDGKRYPRYCLARIFGAKVFELMNWIKDNRYKVLAVYQEIDGIKLIVFNLDECEMVVPDFVTKDDGKKVRKAKKYLPHDWRDSFGMTFREHKNSTSVDIDTHYFVGEKDKEVTFADVNIESSMPNEEDMIMSRYRKEEGKKNA